MFSFDTTGKRCPKPVPHSSWVLFAPSLSPPTVLIAYLLLLVISQTLNACLSSMPLLAASPFNLPWCRYIFRNAQKVGLQELGPRLTLKLRSIQKGTFDSKYGEYIWVHKVRHACLKEREQEREGKVCMWENRQ